MITCLCGNLTSLAQTRWCSEPTRTFVTPRLETGETSAFKGKRLSPQRLRDSAERRCGKASLYSAAQSQARSIEAVPVCWNDRNSGRSPIRKSQKWLQIGL